MGIIIKPVISEKATNNSELLGQYSFYVDTKANKIQIKEAVEKTYGVSVVSVSTLVSAPKVKTRYTKTGFQTGKTNKLKKAIVSLAEGQEIELFG
ncbi:50S ribosomal protein L23 [Empedobacter falsenii]|jgi:large subunit ribosomal protein L23|uniref:Large ribosomal subunit protein uL23 n=2 Tax=Empedobacter TaxID=59734 RepID=A0A376G5K3_9FLAO|nr:MULTISPECIES: 50S ribosomal protein L23 [Empedobacter]HAR71851.1 50S ribosomal protein L23 [Flavobacteriaceae bacterium]MBW1618025.1 50S ribosomal protein L23 [Empedobacter falsenii]MBY0065421.1 50S ribosomal protein L23 [Empedobacter falsenii]MCA4777236.1 50S ribosomal protein L23 [Empedobacter stercoris]MCA4780982.1 50S ribosomal protein L23 [Empedobacter stercoris]